MLVTLPQIIILQSTERDIIKGEFETKQVREPLSIRTEKIKAWHSMMSDDGETIVLFVGDIQFMIPLTKSEFYMKLIEQLNGKALNEQDQDLMRYLEKNLP